MPKPRKKKMHQFGARIEEETWVKLSELAFPEAVSVLVRKILRDYVRGK